MAQQDDENTEVHEPVLLEGVDVWLRPQLGGDFIDCTVGLGGHAQRLLAASTETRVIGIDRDPEALAIASRRLAAFGRRFRPVCANFIEVARVVDEFGIADVRGVLADLGVSSLQLERSHRGFSFSTDAPLDMRMDPGQPQTAADLVNRLPEAELADLIFEYGEERGARKIARAIARERQREPVVSTRRLADIVVRALRVPGRWRIHPATRTFQALRIAVNGELEALASFIPNAVSVLGSGGRLVIISFHSLEDRIVKRTFQLQSGRCLCSVGTSRPGAGRDELVCDRCGARRRVEILTRKPVRASKEEIRRNPRSRSAVMRVCERL
jgi:16S rRNA (cytosine1402-N4)-methyltransferase